MKPAIIAEIERIAGDRLTPDMREEIAERAIKILDDHNRADKLAAVEAAQKAIMEATAASAAKEPGGSK